MTDTIPVAADIEEDLLGAVRIARTLGWGQGVTAPGDGQRPDRAAELSQLLYVSWFTRSVPSSYRQGASAVPTPSLSSRLQAVHAATGHFDEGWQAHRVAPYGAVVARRDDEEIHLLPPDYVNVARLAAPARVGDALWVTRRRDAIDTENGWWQAQGSAGPAPEESMVRLYWNCSVPATMALVAAATGLFEAEGVRHTIKCPVTEMLFGRADGVVVYLGPDSFAATKSSLRQIHERISAHLGSATPPLTLRLGHGVAAAEDPGGGKSFGESRSAAVADGLLQAERAGVTDDGDVVAVILEYLEQAGISPDRPYLSVDSPPDLLTPW